MRISSPYRDGITEGDVLAHASKIEGLSRDELGIFGDNADRIYLECQRVAEHVRERVREARRNRKAESAAAKPLRVS